MAGTARSTFRVASNRALASVRGRTLGWLSTQSSCGNRPWPLRNGRLPEGDAQMQRLAGILGRIGSLCVLDVLDKVAIEKQPALRPFVDRWRSGIPAPS